MVKIHPQKKANQYLHFLHITYYALESIPPNTLEKVAEAFSDPASTSASPSNGNPTRVNHHPPAQHAGWIVCEQAFVSLYYMT